MNDRGPNQESDEKDRVDNAKAHVFSANTNLVLFFLKALLILNGGALVSILIAISDSNNDAIVNTLIGASFYFGIGLSAGIFGILFYSVEIHLDKEVRKNFRGPNRLGILLYGISILLSTTIFICGIWNTILNLRGTLELP
ncbi:MAG: hypothetical protein OXO52_13720 [Rhodospirillales bacterium]|nr:hypothetical protein [Rhodospirillales bacterium]MDE0378650.1 hypothetical protein [Rhodospirillales bacterium]